MGTTTISLSDDAYERLKAAKHDEESFSDVVRRLTSGSQLSEYFGILDDEAADELEDFIERRREDRTAAWDKRRERLREDLEQ
jgi:predicted CopG family antitoxin